MFAEKRLKHAYDCRPTLVNMKGNILFVIVHKQRIRVLLSMSCKHAKAISTYIGCPV